MPSMDVLTMISTSFIFYVPKVLSWLKVNCVWFELLMVLNVFWPESHPCLDLEITRHTLMIHQVSPLKLQKPEKPISFFQIVIMLMVDIHMLKVSVISSLPKKVSTHSLLTCGFGQEIPIVHFEKLGESSTVFQINEIRSF